MAGTHGSAGKAGYYRHPTIHSDTIVFVCEDDLWTVPADGGRAQRLTANPGTISFPSYSADGSLLAFTGRDDGPAEVYVMEASGGSPRRLTWQGCHARTVGWSRDGTAVIFQSDASLPMPRMLELHEVPAAGGPTRRYPYGPARQISFEPRGPGVVLGLNSGDPARWKRYRGGTAGRLWIDRDGDGNFAPLLELEGNLAAPLWIGARIFFLSDHQGHGNLYSCLPSGEDVRRHTHHEDFYVRFPSSDGHRIVYHTGADLHVFHVEEEATHRVEVAFHSSRPELNRKFVSARECLEAATLHPRGHSVACVARGGMFSLPLWEGAALAHSRPPATRYRSTCWLPDDRLVVTSDEAGEDALVVLSTEERRIIEADFGRIVEMSASSTVPCQLALANHRQEIWLVDLESGDAQKLEKSDFHRIEDLTWSPDGRWLAYVYAPTPHGSCLHLYDTDEKRVHEITRPEFRDFSPSFDPHGKFLYFLSARVYDPVYDRHYFELSFPLGVQPCLLTLARDTPSPFERGTRDPLAPDIAGHDGSKEEKEERPETREKLKEDKDKDKAKAVAIDLEGIADRVLAFPVPEGTYFRIRGTREKVFFARLPQEGSLGASWYTEGEPEAKAFLESYDCQEEKKETVLKEITQFDVSADGRTLLVRKGNRLRALAAGIDPKDICASETPGRESGWLDLERLRIEVEPREEWRQMFNEAWRLQRDHFWTPDMSNVDWEGVHRRYFPLVERVGCRSEFSDLVWELQGELGTSHCYELGGDYRPEPKWHQGFLGADLELDSSDTWRIQRLPVGDSWIPSACSPLGAPGVGVQEGDALLAVNAHAVGKERSPHECLVHQCENEVILTVQSPGQDRRRVTVKTLKSEFPLRYRDMVRRNREWVHRETGGRVGYLHIPDMGPRGFSEFHRFFLQEYDRDGLIVDVRYNGGGHVSALLLEKLLRRRVGYDASRWQGATPYPSEAPMGPMVAITNEHAGSDGDIFSHGFKLYGLGPLIGKRTWGGVIGIWPRHALVDGTITTQPEYSFWFEDVGWNVENRGTDPDIEVEIKPQDYASGRDTQLERALVEIQRILREQPAKRPALEDLPDLAPPRLPKHYC